MLFPFGTAVSIVHAGTTDQYGDPTVGTVEIVAGCAVAPRSSSDVADRSRTGVIVGLTVFFPPGTVIVATDSFEIAGTTWQLEGDAGDWRSPFTNWHPGIEVALTRAAG